MLEAGEVCDGIELGSRTCVDLGLEAGTLGCAATCLDFDRTGCGAPATCGNGVIDAAERCDGTNLAGQTCLNLGLGDGQLACAANCGDLDTSGCAGAASCGNGRVDAEEQCDTGIASGVGACPATCPATGSCMSNQLVGVGCQARCEAQIIDTPINGDGCCPDGASAMTDDDCSATCGDRTCDANESCDSCPTDCGACCGNGVVDSGEECDTQISGGAGACPTAATCTAAAACETATLSGADCAASCAVTTITTPMHGDMCCPSGATRADDDDCAVMCNDGICDASEDCASCPTDCECGNGESCVSAMCVDACGDGMILGNEVCEPGNLGGATCMSRGFSGGNLACDSDCLSFDESGCSDAPRITAGPTQLLPNAVSTRVYASPTGGHIAAFTSFSNSTGRGTLVLVPSVGGASTVLGNGVSSWLKWSNDGQWLAYVDDHSNSSNGGTEQLWLVALSSGQRQEIGRNLDISPNIQFTADSRYLVYIDQYSYQSRGGNLRVRTLSTGSTSTVDTAVHDMHVSPRSDSVAYSVDFDDNSDRANLEQVRLPSMQTRSLGSDIRANFVSDKCVYYSRDGSFLVWVDTVDANDRGVLRSQAGASGWPSMLATGVETTQSCFSLSPDGIRLVYKTTYDANNRSGRVYWMSTAGGPATLLGNQVGWTRLQLYTNSSYVPFLDDFVDGFNTDYGTFKYYVAGNAAPTTVASNVYGRFLSHVGGSMTSYAASFDFGLERGQLHALDMATGQSSLLAADSYEWLTYSHDASRGLYVTAFDASTNTGRLEIADLPSGANKRVVAPTAYRSRLGFTPDGAGIFYTTSFNAASNTGDLMFEPQAGGAAVTITSNTRLVSSPTFNESGTYFRTVGSVGGTSSYHGALRVVSSASGASVEVDSSAYRAYWLGASDRLWYSKPSNGGVWVATIGQ